MQIYRLLDERKMPNNFAPIMFDTSLFLKRRKTALARAHKEGKNPWFLHEFACEGTIEILQTIKQDFECGAELFAGNGQFQQIANQAGVLGASRKLAKLEEIEPSLSENKNPNCLSELLLPEIGQDKYDLIIANSGLNWVNDLPGLLLQIRKSLRPEGNFIATFLGGSTLKELRQCFLDVEAEYYGGASPRISPMINCETGVRLLVRAGFHSPVSSSEILKVRYGNVFELFRDIKAMGEAAAFANKNIKPLSRHLIAKVADYYQARYCDGDNRVYASFELITISGWASKSGVVFES